MKKWEMGNGKRLFFPFSGKWEKMGKMEKKI
jgi:hypothetical protein